VAILGGKGRPLLSIGTFCHELCKNGWTDQFGIWVVDLGKPKEAHAQSYSPGGWRQCAHMGGTLVPAGEYDWTVRLRQWCSLTSNYFEHLFGYEFITHTTCLQFLRNNPFQWFLKWRSCIPWTVKNAKFQLQYVLVHISTLRCHTKYIKYLERLRTYNDIICPFICSKSGVISKLMLRYCLADF